MKIALEICCVFRGVNKLYLLIAITWLGLQGIGAGLLTSSKSIDDAHATKATMTEQPKDLVTSPTKEPYNSSLGTKLYLKQFAFFAFYVWANL